MAMTALPPEFREQVPLAPYTTLGLGGPARYFIEVRSVEELAQALDRARSAGYRVWILGGGSNLIVPDEGLDGVVIHIAIGGAVFEPENGGTVVRAGAGVNWDDLVRQTVGRGLAGVECLSGIPGSAGATPIQNVGAYGQEVADTLLWVECLDRDTLDPVQFGAAECGFGYRQSRFKGEDRDRYVVTRVVFRLAPGRPQPRYPELRRAVEESPGYEALSDQDAVAAVRETVLALRRRKSMVLDPGDPNTRSVGSFFTNPVLSGGELEALLERCRRMDGGMKVPTFATTDGMVKVPAGWLVEHAGFSRGYRRGGAGISTRHALALVNLGGSTAELLALAQEIQDGVAERFGVRLEREPVVVGGREARGNGG